MNEDCPGRACFELLGRKWTTQTVWALLAGPRRFSALLHADIPGLSDKVLSRRLAELEGAGIVLRTHYPEIPPRVEYALTPAGLALERVVVEMERWGREFAANPFAANPVAKRATEARQRLTADPLSGRP